MKKLILSLIVLLAIAAGAYAQAYIKSDVANVHAKIVAPIQIDNKVQLNFGNIASASAIATVELVAMSGTPTRNASSLHMLPVNTGLPTAAEFEIIGEPSYLYTVTLPSTATTIDDNASTPNIMIVDNWTVSPASGWALDGTSGKQTIYVGATLHVGASQVAGVYDSDVDFTVSVDYN